MSDLKSKDKQYIVNSYGRFDKAIIQGKGAVCTDIEGNELIDFTSGIGVNCLGFCDDEWVKAVSEQAGRLQHISNLFYTEPMIELAEKLTKRAGMSKVFFANSGAEANECAIKAARKYGNTRSDNKKNRIITLDNAFHGRTMATITATGQEKYHKDFYPFVSGFEYCEPNNIDALKKLVTPETCAIMLEIIQGEGGLLVMEKDFVKAAEKLCAENDMLLIIDEVQTGIGRTGTFFAFQQYDINPDIVSFAKGIGGGLPLGGALFNEKTDSVLTAGDHGTTYGGNPVACAGAGVVMKKMTEEFLADVRKKGDHIRETLKAIPDVYDISGLGMMIGFKVKDREALDVVKAGMEKGLLTLTAKDKIRLLPPLAISMDELDRGLEIIKKII